MAKVMMVLGGGAEGDSGVMVERIKMVSELMRMTVRGNYTQRMLE